MVKTCRACSQEKPLEEFHRHNGAGDGRRGQCKPCVLEKSRGQYDSEKHRWIVVKSRYGLTKEGYYELYDSQGGCCEICGRDESAITRGDFFCIDHCHETGVIRGLLCTECNLAIGYLKKPELLRRAAEYVERGDDLSR